MVFDKSNKKWEIREKQKGKKVQQQIPFGNDRKKSNGSNRFRLRPGGFRRKRIPSLGLICGALNKSVDRNC
jgi:hypothetical protein